MKKLCIGLACGLASLAPMTIQAAANITPMWLRDVMISPDGQQIAFCYKGDIYTVSVNGGEAHRLTTQNSYESYPIWSPDSKQIAFASDRHGNNDVYIMSANGGDATRLTFNSAGELPTAFTPDGKNVLFSAAIQDQASSMLFPSGRLTELYSVPVKGGRSIQISGNAIQMVCYTPDGKKFLYQDQKGMEDEWRKHHTSSVTRDIWVFDTQKKSYTNLTNHAGEDRNPALSADGKTVYLLSERDGGTFNVYSFPLDNPKSLQKVTNYVKHPVRFLSISKNNTMCYTYDGEIYAQGLTGSAKKVAIKVTLDEENPLTELRFNGGAGQGAVSPDGKQIAFIQRGEVFVTSTDYRTTKQISHTVEAESHLSWGKDNRSLYYASERNGHKQIIKATIVREGDPNFSNATLIKEEVILPDAKVERDYPQISPDGKELAFIENRHVLKVVNLETKAVRQITDGSTWTSNSSGFDFSWSPDGKWFTLIIVGNKRDPYYDIAIVSSNGGTITNITESGYASSSPVWVMDGNAILFTSERYGMRSHASWGSQDDAFLVFMNQDAYDKYRLSEEDYKLLKELEKDQKKDTAKKEEAPKGKKGAAPAKAEEKKPEKTINVEVKGIKDRIVRLTPNSSSMSSAILSKDGEKLYYIASFEASGDLWRIDLRKNETKLLQKGIGSAGFDMDDNGNIYIMSGRSVRKMDAKSEKLETLSYDATMTLDRTAEREYIFSNVYQEEKNRFYNVNMHGVDWDSMWNDYKKFLPHIDNNYDFAELLSELLGELNVSHTGGRYSRPSAAGDDRTANLGLLFDMTYTGAGMKIDEVVAGGPFDRASSEVKAGMTVTAINRETITADMDIAQLLNGLANRKTLVTFKDGSKTFDEVILPISSGAMNSLLYKRWIKTEAEKVEKLSNGRLGYVHLKSMDDASFRDAYSDMLGKYNLKDGVIIDTRWNGGGRLHEDIEILVSGEKYLTQVTRGVESCDMPSRRWNKPTIMITCEANYSNAHGTPWVYQHQKLGKVVGAPVPGTMTTVNWVTTQDPTLVYGIPVIGYLQANGQYLENTQLEPDVLVLNAPAEVVKGEDAQLKTAVEELLKQIDKK